LQSDSIRTVTAASFTPLVLEGAGPIVVEFMTYGCGHCRTIEPVVQKVAQMLGTTETIFRVNIAVESELADSYRVASTPTFVMFLDGAEVGRAEGPQPTVPSVMRTMTQMFPHA
jgi:thioredoxin 1